MPDLLDKLKQYGGLVGKSLLIELAPGIAEGLINDLFHEWHVDVAKVTQDVQNNRCLWDEITPDKRKELNRLAAKIGNLDFISPSFIINSVKHDFPEVASLFRNWPEGQEWLARQIEELKKQASEI